MGRQAVLALGVADRVRAGRQLGEEKNDEAFAQKLAEECGKLG